LGRFTLNALHRRRSNNSGMTLVEMLVAIAMASILIVFFFQADVALRRSAYGWIKQASLEETTLLTRQQLGKDLRQVDSLLAADDKELKFTNSGGQTIRYEFSEHTIKRNEVVILPKTVELQAVNLTGTLLCLELVQGTGRHCQITLPIRPWKQRKLERSEI
jgi:prepilin-type N-terminal cleavage/methylation domain-containing protein